MDLTFFFLLPPLEPFLFSRLFLIVFIRFFGRRGLPGSLSVLGTVLRVFCELICLLLIIIPRDSFLVDEEIEALRR